MQLYEEMDTEHKEGDGFWKVDLWPESELWEQLQRFLLGKQLPLAA